MIFKSQFIHTHLPQQAIDLNRIGNNPFFKTESPCIDKRRYGRVERPTRACVYTLRSIENMFEPPVGLDRFVAINPRNNRSIVKRRERSVRISAPRHIDMCSCRNDVWHLSTETRPKTERLPTMNEHIFYP